jgi:peptide/nickel transport system permease protein
VARTAQPPEEVARVKLTRWIAVKVVTAVIMIWVVASAMFMLLRWMPGNPEQDLYSKLITQGVQPAAALHEVQAIYGFQPKQTLLLQYGHYIWDLVHLNLGKSTSETGVPVSHIVFTAFPWTVIMCLTGVLASFLIGMVLGVTAALRRMTKTGDGITWLGALINGIPTYIIAILLFYVFTTEWAIFPQGGTVSILYAPGWNFGYIGSIIDHAVLPVVAYTLAGLGAWMLVTKASVISVLGDDFILAAELRGIRPWTIGRYILRNAMLPLFTILAIALGLMLGGSIYIEQVFNYPGLGQTIINALNVNDYPLLSGTFILIIVAVIAANFLADLAYPFIDPRVRRS